MDTMVPEEEIFKRAENLRAMLVAEGLHGALLIHAVDVYYYSGTRQNSVLWIPVNGNPVLLVRKSYNRAKMECKIADIRPFPSSKDLPDIFGKQTRKIGLTFDVLPVQHFNFYRNVLPDREFIDISAVNRELRSIKSAWELAQMRASGGKLAEAFGQIPDILSPGMRELDLAAEFESRMRKLGIGGFLRIRGFNQEITGLAAAGASAAVAGCFDGPVTGRGLWTSAPYGSSADVIRKGSPIIVDYGGFFNGYIVDMTRIFCFGHMEPELERAFRVSLDIQTWIIENLLPGRICEEIFLGALRRAADEGLSEYFMGYPGELAKFVGHGVGLELDELPVLAPKFKYPLQSGQTIAVEPKFIFPGKGAVGIENTFVVTDKGCEKLTTLSDDIVYL